MKGSLPFPDDAHDIRSHLEHEPGEHSEKPEAFRALVERVSPGPRLELFGRRPVKGWTVWGGSGRAFGVLAGKCAMSLRNRILAYLQAGHSLTQAECTERFHTSRLAPVIFSLRGEGHEIATETETVRRLDGRTSCIARYRLVTKKPAGLFGDVSREPDSH